MVYSFFSSKYLIYALSLSLFYKGARLLAPLMIFLQIQVSGQEILDCGMPSDVPTSDALSAYSQITQYAGNVASGTLVEIPIHVVILDDGNQNVTQILSRINSSINGANQFFTLNYNFYLCSFDIIEVSSEELNFTSTQQEFQALYELAHADNAINFYVTNTIFLGNNPAGGVARFPWSAYPNNMVVFRSSQVWRDDLIAHELGHYFGLLHTYQNSPYDPELPCELYGDLICETPPDPGVGICGNQCNDITCDFTINLSVPITWEFDPDRHNLMSNYPCFPYSFVGEQLDVMSVFLFHDPARNFVFANPHLLDCIENIPYPDGFVVRPTGNQLQGGQEDPFYDVNVEFFHSNLTTLQCSPSTGDNGLFTIDDCSILPETGAITYGPKRNDIANTSYCYLNGVTTFDIIKITKHILGVDPFQSPYQYIAADVNNSGFITTMDIIQIRKLILGLEDEFLNVDSWRFVPAVAFKDVSFESAFNSNPLTASWDAIDGARAYLAIGDQDSYLDFVDAHTSQPSISDPDIWSFYAVKSGDVSFSADVQNMSDEVCLSGLRDDEGETIIFTETKISSDLLASIITTEELLTASISVGELESFDLEGYQFSLSFDQYQLELVAIEPGNIAFSSEDFVIDYSGANAVIKTLWANFKPNPISVNEDEKFFQLVFRPKTDLTNLAGLISFGNDPSIADLIFKEGASKADAVVLQVDYDKISIKDFIIREAYGNPFSATGNLHIKLEMRAIKDVSILLHDDFGHNVVLGYDNLILGENNIEIPAGTVSILQNGVIYYTIATDEQVQSGTIIKMQ